MLFDCYEYCTPHEQVTVCLNTLISQAYDARWCPISTLVKFHSSSLLGNQKYHYNAISSQIALCSLLLHHRALGDN